MPKTKAKAEAKTAAAPTIQKQLEAPEKLGGPQRAAPAVSPALPPPNGKPPAGRAADVMTAPEQGAGSAGRARMMRSMQQSVGNVRISRLLRPIVQAKLTVNEPGDSYEQEADRVADQVARTPVPTDKEPAVELTPPTVQRCPACQRQIQRQARDADEPCPECRERMRREGTVQRQAGRAGVPAPAPELESYLQSSKGGGRSLPKGTRAADVMTAPEQGAGAGGRARMMRGMQQSVGNARISRLGPPTVQTKLTVNQPGDSYEQEADRVADQVARTPVPTNDEPAAAPTPPAMQRCPACQRQIQRQARDTGEPCPECRHRMEQGGTVQRQVTSSETPEVTPETESYLGSTQGGGRPLPAGTRDAAEAHLNRDFGDVRVHDDIAANKAAQSLNARAFTHGSDVYLARGESARDRRLMGHELTHTIQQGNSTVRSKIQRKPTGNSPLTSRVFAYPDFEEINADDKHVLKKGDKGPYVAIMQRALLELNYPLPKYGADGKFGNETKAALKSFQRDAGFEGKGVDGILGHKTLRALDTRFSAAARKTYRSRPSGDYVLVRIPNIGRTYDDSFEDKHELALLQLREALKISRDEAAKLLPSKPAEIGKPGLVWWTRYSGVGPEDVEAGYYDTLLSKAAYDQFRARAVHIRGPRKTESEIEEEARTAFYKLQGKKRLYELYKELKYLDEAITAARIGQVASLAGIPSILFSKYPLWKLEAMRAATKAALDTELAKLGITFDEFEKSIDNFLASFRQFAVLTAIRMLDSNETKTRIAQGQLQNLENVQKIKNIIAKLNLLYEEAEKNWWKGVSLELTRDAWRITGHKDLDSIIERSVKGLPFIGGVITSTDAAYRTFAIYRYQDGKKGFLNDYFRRAQEAENKAHAILAAAAQKYNILAYPDLDLKGKGEEYARMSNPELQAKLASFIGDGGEGVLANIAKMKKELQSNPDLIWELKPVWTQAMRGLGLTKEDPQFQIIEKEVKRRESEKRTRDILLAVGGIALGLLALASGPVGWAALVGSIVVDSIDAYIQYQEISFLRTARRTALDPKDALSDVDPSWAWFYISLAGIALDFLDVVKAIKVARTAKSAKALIAKTQDDLLAEVARLEKLGNLEEAAKVRQLFETLEKNKDEFAKHLDILLKLEGEPQLMLRLSEAMANEDVAKAIKALGAHVGVDSPLFLTALKFYGGVGTDFAEELPELLRLIKQGGLKANPELLQDVLTHPPLQKVMLDHPRDPDLLLREWAAWRGYKATGRVVTFVDYLKNAGYAVDLRKGASLAAEFGKGFKELPNLAKNRQVLRQIEPGLMDALDAGKLPAQVQETLLRHLSDDIIGSTDDLTRASKRMYDSLGEKLGGSLQTAAEYRRLTTLIKDPALAQKILESATSIPGQGAFVKLLTKHGPKISPDVFEDLIRIGVVTDEDTLLRLIRDTDFRKALAKYSDVVAIVKKCDSPCFPPIATAEDMERLHKILAAHDDIDYAKLNEFLYRHRGSRTDWDKALTQLDTNWRSVFRGGFRGVEDIVIPEAYRSIKNIDRKLKNLVNRGLPPSLLDDILTQAAGASRDGTELLEIMARAANKSDVRKMKNFGLLFYSLASSNAARYREALALIQRIGRSNTAIGKVDKILTEIKLDDIIAIRHSLPDETVTIEKLYRLVTRIDGNREDILKVIRESGTGSGKDTPDLSRLLKSLDNLGSGAHKRADILDELARMGTKPELPEFKATSELEKRFKDELFVRWEESMGKREGWKKWMREKLGALSADEFEKRLVKHLGLDPRDPLISVTLQKIVADGRIDRFNLLRALSNAAETKRALLFMGQLNELGVKGVRGVDQVVGDLAAGGNNFKGAWWVLRYTDNQGLWGKILDFEFPTAVGDEIRRYDIRLQGGELLQFKSWESWSNASFVKQFAQDWERTGGRRLRWVFELTGDLSSKERILNLARGAILSSENKIIRDHAKEILDALDEIIRAGDEALGL